MHFTSSSYGEMYTFDPWETIYKIQFNTQLLCPKQDLSGSDTIDSYIFILVFQSITASLLSLVTTSVSSSRSEFKMSWSQRNKEHFKFFT